MSNCITCGKGMSKSIKDVIEAYKKQGLNYWIYQGKEGGDFFLVNDAKMKEVLNKFKTKKGYKKGFNYAHIKEFKGY